MQKPQKTRKSKVLGERWEVDQNTGEVLAIQTIRYPAEDDYRKFYCDFDYGGLGSSFKELISLSKRMSSSGGRDGGNIVRIDKHLIEIMANECGVSPGRFWSIINEFLKTGILRRLHRGVYQINPYMCGIGKWASIEKLRHEWDNAKAAEQAENEA